MKHSNATVVRPWAVFRAQLLAALADYFNVFTLRFGKCERMVTITNVNGWKPKSLQWLPPLSVEYLRIRRETSGTIVYQSPRPGAAAEADALESKFNQISEQLRGQFQK